MKVNDMDFKPGDVVRHKICKLSMMVLPSQKRNDLADGPLVNCRYIKTDGSYWSDYFYNFELEVIK